MNHGLIPGGVSLRTGRQAVFCTIVSPMNNQDGLGETLCDLSQARSAPYKNTWKHFQDTVFWCNLKLAQQRGLQFYQTRSHAVIFCDTLPAECIEKAICMKTKDQLYRRESVILRPRVVLEANSQSGSQDLPVQEARSSWESQQDADSYVETRSNTADYRVTRFIGLNGETAGCTATTATSQNLSIMFEKHRHKKQLLKDMSQKAGDQQVQRGITTITRRHEIQQSSSKFATILQNSNVLIAKFLYGNRDHLLQLREKF